MIGCIGRILAQGEVGDRTIRILEPMIETFNKAGADPSPDADRDRPRADPDELVLKLSMPIEKVHKLLTIAQQPIGLKTGTDGDEELNLG